MRKETCKNVLVHHLFGIPVKTLNKSRVSYRFKGYHRFGKMNEKRYIFDMKLGAWRLVGKVKLLPVRAAFNWVSKNQNE